MKKRSILIVLVMVLGAAAAFAQHGPGEGDYGYSFTVSATNASGSPVSGATVTIDNLAGTDLAQGGAPYTYTYGGVYYGPNYPPPALVTVNVQAPGYVPSGPQTVSAAGTLNVALVADESSQIQQTLNQDSQQIQSAGLTRDQVQTFLQQVQSDVNTNVQDSINNEKTAMGNDAAATLLSQNASTIEAEAFAGVLKNTDVVNAITTGDPVVVATGALSDAERDIACAFHGHLVSVDRTYESDRSAWSSFGIGWSFTYDTRVILGDDLGLDQLAQHLQASTAQLLSTYNQDSTDYTNLLASLQSQLSQAQSADAAAAGAITSAQQTLNEIASSPNPSYYAALQTQAQQELTQAQTTKQQLDASIASLQQQIAALAPVSANLQSIQQAYNQVLAQATTVANEDKLAQADRSKNQYALHSQDPASYRTAGISTVTWIDERGIPHEYTVQTAPAYTATATYADGSANFYPNGAVLSPITPHDDPLALLPDGSFLLTKKDQTRYFYDFHGLLNKIVDTNGNTIRMVYDANHELTDVIDGFGRDLKLQRTNGFITSATDPRRTDLPVRLRWLRRAHECHRPGGKRHEVRVHERCTHRD